MCLQPRTIVNRRYIKRPYLLRNAELFPHDYYIQVPCGRCSQCLKNTADSWRKRLKEELSTDVFHRARFVTMTFNQTSYRRFRDCPERAIRLFLERYRKQYGVSLRHWFVTELGHVDGRLHIHGILFDARWSYGHDPNFFAPYNRQLRKFWKYGNTWTGFAEQNTVGYIVKYIRKVNPSRPLFRPRTYVSPGLGSSWFSGSEAAYCRSVSSELYVHNSYVENNFNKQLPRYYFTKLYDERQRYLASRSRFFSSDRVYQIGQRTFTSFEEFNKFRSSLLESDYKISGRPRLMEFHPRLPSFSLPYIDTLFRYCKEHFRKIIDYWQELFPKFDITIYFNKLYKFYHYGCSPSAEVVCAEA